MCVQSVALPNVLRMSEADAKAWLEKQQRQAKDAKKSVS